MNSYSFTLFIFVAIIFLRYSSSTKAATCHPDDEAGLLAFKSGITQDPLGHLSLWKKGTDCCSWVAVTCTRGNRVTELNLDGSSVLGGKFLSGTISPLLTKLQHLEVISLISFRKLTGSFPLFLFRLPKLRLIHIMNNHLSGPLPAHISTLHQLEDLILEGNRFTGQIPSSISNLTRLVRLNLGGNRLSGTISDIFKPMTNLQYLDLSRNGFSGKLPPSFSSLAPTLNYLDLSKNNLSGMIPDYLSRFEALSTLTLSENKYSGVVPTSFASLTSIYHLDLSHNLLTGPFHALKSSIGYLDLSYNQFNLKTIPEWVTSSTSSYSLKLAKCGIKMNLSDWRPVKTKLFNNIDLSENEISGSPTWFLNMMEDLLEFQASGNKLQFDMGKLSFAKSLRILDLSRNLVFGKVPWTVAKLKKLNLSQNHLCGKLPVTKFPASAFAGNDCLCGSPLSPCKA